LAWRNVTNFLQGQEFVFPNRTTCIMGRASDCSPRLPDDADHKTISRHHCLLDVYHADVPYNRDLAQE
jgi:pSer/pThr/pTyr-binding forkhead associated (FHA) protein